LPRLGAEHRQTIAHSVSCGFMSNPEASPGRGDRTPAPPRPPPFVPFVSFVVQRTTKASQPRRTPSPRNPSSLCVPSVHGPTTALHLLENQAGKEQGSQQETQGDSKSELLVRGGGPLRVFASTNELRTGSLIPTHGSEGRVPPPGEAYPSAAWGHAAYSTASGDWVLACRNYLCRPRALTRLWMSWKF